MIRLITHDGFVFVTVAIMWRYHKRIYLPGTLKAVDAFAKKTLRETEASLIYTTDSMERGYTGFGPICSPDAGIQKFAHIKTMVTEELKFMMNGWFLKIFTSEPFNLATKKIWRLTESMWMEIILHQIVDGQLQKNKQETRGLQELSPIMETKRFCKTGLMNTA